MASVVVVFASCKRSAEFHVDMAAIKLQAQLRMEHVMSPPAPKAAMNQLFAAIAADGEIRERGTALITALGADPAIATPLANLMATAEGAPEIFVEAFDHLRGDPALVSAVEDLLDRW